MVPVPARFQGSVPLFLHSASFCCKSGSPTFVPHLLQCSFLAQSRVRPLPLCKNSPFIALGLHSLSSNRTLALHLSVLSLLGNGTRLTGRWPERASVACSKEAEAFFLRAGPLVSLQKQFSNFHLSRRPRSQAGGQGRVSSLFLPSSLPAPPLSLPPPPSPAP